MTEELQIYVQDRGFAIVDRDISPTFETMDYSTGLAGVMESAALVSAGIDRGYVTVTTQARADRPALNTPQQWDDLAAWDDVAEFSLFVPHGALAVAQLEYPPGEAPQGTSLSPSGPGHYRVRIHASGRDRYYDQVVAESGERYHVIAWPEPPSTALVIKATSRCGYGLRMNQLHAPAYAPVPPTPEDDAEAEYQAALRRNLLRQANSPPRVRDQMSDG